MQVLKRYAKRLAPVGLAIALVTAISSPAAHAATATSVSVQPTDPTAAATTNWTITGTGFSATTIGCIYVYIDSAAGFGSASAAATPTAATNLTGTLLNAGTWNTQATSVGGTSAYKWISTAGYTVNNSASRTLIMAITNPAAGSYYVQVKTFSDNTCSTPIDTASSAVAITTNSLVSVTVDPTFTFAVNLQGTGVTCNGITTGSGSTVASTSSTVPFGHLAAGARAIGVQQLQVTTNAGSGYVVDMRSTAGSANVLKGSGAHVITDATSGALPSAGTAFFGYSTDSTTAAITSGNIKPVPQSGGNDVVANGVAGTSLNNCVAFAVGASASTPADTYTSTIVYTAIPTF